MFEWKLFTPSGPKAKNATFGPVAGIQPAAKIFTLNFYLQKNIFPNIFFFKNSSNIFYHYQTPNIYSWHWHHLEGGLH